MKTQNDKNPWKKISHKYGKIYQPLQEKQQEGMKNKGKTTEVNEQICASDITENKKTIQPQNILLSPRQKKIKKKRICSHISNRKKLIYIIYVQTTITQETKMKIQIKKKIELYLLDLILIKWLK